MTARIPFLSLTAVGLSAAIACSQQEQSIYLFDCGGAIQRVDGGDSVTAATRVADIDSTLPHRVRDGCAIHGGRHDAAMGRLVLEVQTEPWMDAQDEPPTRLLSLATPALSMLPTDATAPRPPERLDRQAIAGSLEAIESPFARSARYVLDDGTTLLLQERADEPDEPQLAFVDRLWASGMVSFNRALSDATGRYALFDLATGTQLGDVVSARGEVQEHRVVCFTSGGRIYLAAARDTLLLLDVREPAWHSTIGDLTVDLYWAACASN